MNSAIHVQLNTTAEQIVRLKALQTAFSAVCNALSPIVQNTRCWNRVTLHHLAYRALREQFPLVGSQMVCNAIYSVSRTCRIVFQHPSSPWNIAKLGDRPLPGLQFLPGSPVYFDRHTLSLKHGRLSMYTLDGRMHFDLNLGATDEMRFHNEKLREIVLGSNAQGFALSFHFSEEAEADTEAASATAPSPELPELPDLPEYLLVIEANNAAGLPMADPSPPHLLTPVAA